MYHICRPDKNLQHISIALLTNGENATPVEEKASGKKDSEVVSEKSGPTSVELTVTTEVNVDSQQNSQPAIMQGIYNV